MILLRILRSLDYDTKVVITGDIDFRVSGANQRSLVEAERYAGTGASAGRTAN